jgi:hypothetical protein
MYDSGTLTVWAKAITEYGCVDSVSTVITSGQAASISLYAGSDDLTTEDLKAMTPVQWRTTCAAGATVTGLPSGVNGVWANNIVTISGSPTACGTFNYTVTSTDAQGAPVGTVGGVLKVYSVCEDCYDFANVCNESVQQFSRYSWVIGAPVSVSWTDAQNACYYKEWPYGSWRLPNRGHTNCLLAQAAETLPISHVWTITECSPPANSHYYATTVPYYKTVCAPVGSTFGVMCIKL